MTKIIAVTGGTGFVGKHLIRELIHQGYHVKALTRSPQAETSNVNWIKGDLENTDSLKKLIENSDALIHLAGLIKTKRKENFKLINSETIPKLLEIVHNMSSKPHFILLSSLAARERHLSHYAESKRKGEEFLMSGAKNIPWTILRPPGIYGPEDLETLKIFKAVSSGIAPLPKNSHNRASWIYAPDLAKAIISLLGNTACFGQCLDVDDGKEGGYSNQELYATASNILNVKPLQFTIPKFGLTFISHLNVLFSTFFGYTPMITPDKINELCYPDWICHGPHVMKVTEWKPQTDLKQGFENTLKWYKENNLI
ncbi:MAG: NAD(P)-dependent oxidoreductase [Emcibacter sp.]|nr:NAD(P)-dependent oxidoreductase [Emcibacter sp.]